MGPIWTLENGLLTSKAQQGSSHTEQGSHEAGSYCTFLYSLCTHSWNKMLRRKETKTQFSSLTFGMAAWLGLALSAGSECSAFLWAVFEVSSEGIGRGRGETALNLTEKWAIIWFFIIKSFSTLQSRRHFCMVKLDARDFESYCNLFTSPSLILPSPHLCLHQFPFFPSLHLIPLLPDYFSPKAFATTVLTPNSKTQRENQVINHQSCFSLALCRSPKKPPCSVWNWQELYPVCMPRFSSYSLHSEAQGSHYRSVLKHN